MPPIASLGNVSAQVSPVPRQLTRFVGREWELAEIRRLLDSSRLVTLTGIGGAGKTRLAAEVAQRAAATHQDGVAWVDLSSISDPTLVDRHVSSAMGFSESLERTCVDILVDMLRPLSLLVVLDNCEHLIEACASLVHAMLSEAPGVRILATSREALGVDGEVSTRSPTSRPRSPCPSRSTFRGTTRRATESAGTKS